MVLRSRGRGRVGRRQPCLTNVQCPITNFELRNRLFDIGRFAFLPRRPDARDQNRDQLITFLADAVDTVPTQAHPVSKFEPGLRLPELLETDFELVNEILSRFRRLRLTVVGKR